MIHINFLTHVNSIFVISNFKLILSRRQKRHRHNSWIFSFLIATQDEVYGPISFPILFFYNIHDNFSLKLFITYHILKTLLRYAIARVKLRPTILG